MAERPAFDLLDLSRDAELLISAGEIQSCIARIADALNSRYKQVRSPLLVMCVMNGALFFAGQLLPRLVFPLQLDYLHATRYRGQLRGGALEFLVRPRQPLAGRDLLLLDDIFDEGHTLARITEELKAAGVRSLYTTVLVEKLHKCKVRGFTPDLVGVQVPDRYVFGCGMDYRELYRNLPAIYALRSDREADRSSADSTSRDGVC